MLAALASFPKPFQSFAASFPSANFTPIRRGVGIFESRGGTIAWLVRDEALVAVDSQFPESAAVCLEGLKKKTARPMDFLINTHHHGDHTAGNIVFKDVVDRVVSHENCRINLEKTALAQNALDKNLLADTIVIDNASFKLAKESVECRYFGRGHTNGDIVVYFENANIAHVGDLVFNRRFPFIDVRFSIPDKFTKLSLSIIETNNPMV